MTTNERTYTTDWERGELDRALPDWRDFGETSPTVMGALAAIRTERGAKPKTVIEALAEAKRAIQAVPKDQESKPEDGQRGPRYRFRGIEGILNACHQATADAGVICVPSDGDLTVETWQGYGEKAALSWRLYRLEVLWTIYGPDGSSIECRNLGEALDNGDKALGKARSYAQKDLYVRIYEIPTNDPDMGDTEHDTEARRAAAAAEGEAAAAAPTIELATEAAVLSVLNGLTACLDRTGGEYSDAWREAVATTEKPGTYRRESLEAMAAGDRPKCPAAAIPVMQRIISDWQAALDAADAVMDPTPDPEPTGVSADAEETTDAVEEEPTPDHADDPCALCGSTRSKKVEVDGVWRCQNASDCERRARERDVREATEDIEVEESNGAVICAGCSEGIPEGGLVTYDDSGDAYHAECNPTLD